MKGILSLKTAPTTEPVTTSEAKLYCKIDISDDDVLIASLVTAARRWVENVTSNRLVTQTWYWYLDEFPDEDTLEFPIGPVTALASIKYTSEAGTQATMAAGDYDTDFNSQPPNPARVSLDDGVSWPATDLKEINGVVLEFTVGYAAIPEEFKLAIKMLVEHWYEHRGPVSELRLEEAPMTVQILLAQYEMRQRGRE